MSSLLTGSARRAIAGILLAIPLASTALEINEIRIDHTGSDVDEYFELAGTPVESLAGLTYIVIGDALATGDGTVESIAPLTGLVIQPDGFLSVHKLGTVGNCGPYDLDMTLNFENSDNVTHLLVRDLNPAINTGNGFGGSDLDVDNDGNIDASGDYDGDSIDDGAPFSSIVDCVGLVETVGTGNLLYCSTTVGPDGSFVPAHIYRCDNSWLIGSFSDPCSTDSPGAANACTIPVESRSWSSVKEGYREE